MAYSAEVNRIARSALPRILALAAVVGVSSAAEAQWIPTRSFGVRDGLAQSQVMALVHDSHGYLWAATQGGLSRGDGRRFTTFTTADGLPDDVVTALAAGDDGRVWLGTDSGAVARWNGDGFTSWPGPGGQPAAVTGLVRLGPTRLLVGTSSGLWRWSPENAELLFEGKVQRLTPAPGPLDEGDLWTWPLVVAGETLRCNGSTLVPVDLRPAFADDETVLAAAVSRSELVLGSDHGRLVVLPHGGAWRELHHGQAPIHALLPAGDGGVWVGAGDGLWQVSASGRAVRQPLVASDPGLEIRTLAEDRDGNLWASPWSGGLFQLDPEGFAVFNRSSGFPATQVWGFLEDDEGCLWLASEDAGALRWCHEGVREQLRAGAELPPGRAISLESDGGGGIWVATAGGVVHRDRERRLERYTTAEGLPDDYTRDLLLDPSGRLWAATRGGLARLEGGRFSSWTAAEGLPDANLRGLAVDRSGALWIATHGAGLVRFDGERFVTLGPAEGLPHPRVWCVMVDSTDRLWVGTDAGIWVHPLHGSGDRTVPVEAGLPSPNVLFLAEDREGLTWAGTTRGVARLDVEGRVVRTLSADDGLAGSEGASNAALVDRSGHLWMGLAEGVTRVDPSRLPSNPVPPSLAVERVLVNGEPVPGAFPLHASDLGEPRPLTVGPRPTDLRFELAALAFTAPERVRFRFWLEGYEPEPGRPTDERAVTYRHLPPGRFRFRLAACNSDGVWADPPLSLSLTVLPAWYQAWWFRAAVVLLAAAAVAGAFLARAAVDRRRRVRLEREVAARTAELAAANLRITDQNRRLEELSRTDPLTGLANRRTLEEQLPLEMAILRRELDRHGGRVPDDYHGCAVFVLDLDHFKTVNDRWGHDTGDTALRMLADALKASLREVDLPVRWGGEELVILTRSVDRAGVLALAHKLLTTVAATRVPVPDGVELALSASVGFVLHPLTTEQPLDGADWRSLVDAADRLMYLAKERGRGRACGVRWGADIPPHGSGREVLQRIQRDPANPPDGLELVEVVLPV